MSKYYRNEGFIPVHGNYRQLLTYQKSVIIYQGTYYFTHKYFNKYDRTIGQMIQAARSGKQNIIEGSMASATSKETEIVLTSVARASFEELKNDYIDFLLVRNLSVWDKNHEYYEHLTERLKTPNATYEVFRKGIESENPEVSANVMAGLINQTSYLLLRQINRLERDIIDNGGFRERIYQARINKKRQ